MLKRRKKKSHNFKIVRECLGIKYAVPSEELNMILYHHRIIAFQVGKVYNRKHNK